MRPRRQQVDQAYLAEKSAQFKEVRPDFDILGWYTNGGEVRGGTAGFGAPVALMSVAAGGGGAPEGA